MFENLALSAIQEENARKLVKILLNQVEELSASLRDARVEIQQLRDENNRLKGQTQGQSECSETGHGEALCGEGTAQISGAAQKGEESRFGGSPDRSDCHSAGNPAERCDVRMWAFRFRQRKFRAC